MGFVDGGGNIAIATAPPIIFRVLYCKQFMEFLNLIFYACLTLRFPDVETNLGPRCPVPPVCRTLCSKVLVLEGTLVT